MLSPPSSRRRGCGPSLACLALFAVCTVLLTQFTRAEDATGSINDDDVSTTVSTNQTVGENQEEDVDFEQVLRDALAGGFANMPRSLRRKILEADVRPECTAGLLRTIRAFQNLEPWALKLFDSSGKLPTGLLQGSRVELGAFDECLETAALDSFGEVFTHGQYCNLLVYFKNATAIQQRIDSVSSILHPKFTYFKNYFSVEEVPALRLAICFVQDCNEQDLQALVDTVKPSLVRIEVSNCVTAEMEPWTVAQIGIVIFLGIIIAAVIFSTWVDYCTKNKPKWQKEHSTLYELCKGFSLISNTRMLLRVADKANAEQHALQFLHGMRFWCIVHIVLCHCGQTMSDSWSRLLNLLILSDDWSFMIITAGFSSVGTFFFLSGFFLCLTVSRQKRTGPAVFVIGVLRRFIRTCIPLFFIIMCMYLLPRFVTGPDTKAFFQKMYREMEVHWWHLLVMIRNFFDITPWDVLPHFWYLSTDFQLFTISLLVLLVFKSRKMLAVAAFLLLSLLGCAVGTWVVDASDLPPFMIFPGPILQVMQRTVNEYYTRPYYHAVCYFSGCMTFLLMDDFRKRRISKVVVYAGWTVAVICGLLCTFMKLAWYRDPDPTSHGVALLVAFFDRILWSIFLIWTTLACASGRGGPVNTFLSWGAFVPLSKLSYGVYLIHVPFIELLLHASRERLFWSKFTTVTLFNSVLIWSFQLAFLSFLACEAPTGALDKLLFGMLTGGGRSKRQEHKPNCNGNIQKPEIKIEDTVISRC
ncbi:nose resistant to fluoxetine protein 6-like isoform X1 [Amblyomma americanum]